MIFALLVTLLATSGLPAESLPPRPGSALPAVADSLTSSDPFGVAGLPGAPDSLGAPGSVRGNLFAGFS